MLGYVKTTKLVDTTRMAVILQGPAPTYVPYCGYRDASPTNMTVETSRLSVGTSKNTARTYYDPARTIETYNGFSVTRLDRQWKSLEFRYPSGSYVGGGYCGDSVAVRHVDAIGTGAFTEPATYLDSLASSLSVTNAAKAACLKNASDVAANLSITVCEMPKTLRMVGDIARRVAEGIKYAKRGDVVGAVKHVYASPYVVTDVKVGLKRFRHAQTRVKRERMKMRNRQTYADNWMMYQYGIMPAVKDAENIAVLAAKQGYKRNRYFTVSATCCSQPGGYVGRGELMTYETRRQTFGDYLIYPSVVMNFVRVDKSGRSVRAGLCLRADSPELVASNQFFGSFTSLGWELLPYSFVLDHFWRIGEYIANQTALNGLTVLGGYTSEKTTVNTQVSGISRGSVKGSGSGTTSSSHALNRALWTGASPPPLPGSMLNGNARWQNFMTYLSIINQRMR